MALDHRIGKKVIKHARREEAVGTRVDPYPYIGVVKNNLDSTRSGRLQVYIPDLGGPADDENNWRTVSYASPYQGFTSQTQFSNEKPSTANRFNTVSHSYGMWMVPPDIGVHVIVIFIAGDPLRGYWIACVNPNLSHYMTPGLAGSVYVDPESLAAGERSAAQGHALPVAEFNESPQNFTNSSYYLNNKPVHRVQYDILVGQGLDRDLVRGVISSSSQRESPSHVFGISTPGRSIDDPAEDKAYLGKLKSGQVDNKYLFTRTRKGGHTFVMDDGADTGEDQLVRVRTARGHQLLMNDTNEILYIGNANGKSWVELAQDGSVHVYANGSINLRSETNINIHSDGDILMHAEGNFKVKCKGDYALESNSMNMMTSGKFAVTADTGAEFKVGFFNVDSSAKVSIKADGSLALQGSPIKQNSGGTATVNKIKPMNLNHLPDAVSAGAGWQAAPNKLNTLVKVAPTHEPFARNDKMQVYAPQTPGIQPAQSFSGSTDVLAAEQTSTQGVQDAATVKDLRQQPQANGTVGNLSQDEVTALFAAIAKRESQGSGGYAAVNQLGYVGKYQMGYQTLQSLGYVQSSVTSNDQLKNPNSWLGKNGIDSVDTWYNSTAEQEQAMLDLTKRNYSELCRNGTITKDLPSNDQAGILAVAHLLGPTGANRWRAGAGGQDANHTSGSSYFQTGRYAVSVLATQSDAVKNG